MFSTMRDHLEQLLLVRSYAILVSASTLHSNGRHLTLRSLRPALLDNELVQPKLLRRPLQHPLLDATLRDEPEHIHLLRLPNPVRAIHRLQVSLRVPVRVVQDDNVSSGEVDAEAPSTGRKQEDELLRVGLVVFVDRDDTVLVRSASVDPAVLYLPRQR